MEVSDEKVLRAYCRACEDSLAERNSACDTYLHEKDELMAKAIQLTEKAIFSPMKHPGFRVTNIVFPTDDDPEVRLEINHTVTFRLDANSGDGHFSVVVKKDENTTFISKELKYFCFHFAEKIVPQLISNRAELQRLYDEDKLHTLLTLKKRKKNND